MKHEKHFSKTEARKYRLSSGYLFLLLAGTLTILHSCSNRSQTSMMKNVTGKAGELVVVIPQDIWAGETGQTMKEILAQPHLGLPQDEPIFDVISIPHEAFADIFKTTRSLLLVTVQPSADSTGVTFQRNTYAYTQTIVSIRARNAGELRDLFLEASDKIIAFYLKAEKDRMVMNYAKYNEKVVSKATEEQFGITLNVPPGFVVAEKTDDFMWLRYEKTLDDFDQGIFIYTYPYESDSTFTLDYLLAKRNIFLKNHVPGPIEGSYMTTERELPILLNTLKKNGNYAAEMRGLWRVENDFMGGPFISLSILDLLQKRVVTFDAYVYAPGKNKRNLLWQVESMIQSVQFLQQDDMDKINRQFD
ncbi:MAG TPA: DUF4837 family protein [Prolixibacteraceae bacterium]|nr:DUF4837 family protein [Prolixibacteraceae bacterium]